MEFLGAIADAYAASGEIALSPGQFQPVAADDVAEVLVDVVDQPPLNGILEVAGPERGPLDVVMARYLQLRGDPRHVRRDPEVGYFGGHVEDFSLVPTGMHRLGKLELESWASDLPVPKTRKEV
jgi:uncharacterized protein YbjT (DUF2867 family)